MRDSDRLPSRAAALIVRADEVYVSAASVWEIAIKHALGRGQMPVSAAQALHLHADPFDRLLVAQALDEPLTLLTSDRAVAAYSDAVLLV